MRNVCVVVVMVILSACAAAAPPLEPTAKFQNAVYRAGDQIPTSTKPDEARPAVDMKAPSKPTHIYWFLSGRWAALGSRLVGLWILDFSREPAPIIGYTKIVRVGGLSFRLVGHPLRRFSE
jgi:hypothetical protein